MSPFFNLNLSLYTHWEKILYMICTNRSVMHNNVHSLKQWKLEKKEKKNEGSVNNLGHSVLIIISNLSRHCMLTESL